MTMGTVEPELVSVAEPDAIVELAVRLQVPDADSMAVPPVAVQLTYPGSASTRFRRLR
jgi:hypothetical protein